MLDALCIGAGPSYLSLADQNLSLLAWRSAKVVNALAGFRIHTLHDKDGLIDREKRSEAEQWRRSA